MENSIKPNDLLWEKTKIKGFLSKQLIDVENGGLKLIKVEPSSLYPVHLHPEKIEFIYILEGTPEISIGDNLYTGKVGEFYILKNAIKHSISNKGNSDCILLVGAIKS